MSSSQKIKSNEKIENNNDFTSFKTLTPFTDSILDIITLKNGKILIFTYFEPIKILNEETFEEELSIKENSEENPYNIIIELNDSRLCTGLKDNFLIISLKDNEYKIEENIKATSEIISLYELKDGRIIIGNFD